MNALEIVFWVDLLSRLISEDISEAIQ